MVCLYCGSETQVINSRRQKRNNQVWRRRRCQECSALFTTHEAADLTGVIRVRSNGTLRPYDNNILFTEVLLSLQDRKKCYEEAREITNTVTQKLLLAPDFPLVDTSYISRTAGKVLKSFSKRAWQRFVLEHPSLQTQFTS
ncbi:MAG TPA: hypothetical protein VMT23_01430 [Candidatus Binatia bacterium]|nr:hypothetical protein [Candidatus Binatia bacterium]